MRTALCFSLLLLGCSDDPAPTTVWTPADHAQPPQQQVDPSRVPRQTPDRPREPEGAERASAAATLWRLSCAGCHGAEGRGDGREFPGQIVDFTDPEWQTAVSNEDIARVITLGKPPMPPFGEIIAPAGIAALVEHVRRLGAPGDAAPEDPEPSEAAPATSNGTDD